MRMPTCKRVSTERDAGEPTDPERLEVDTPIPAPHQTHTIEKNRGVTVRFIFIAARK